MPAAAATVPIVAESAAPDTESELRNWIKDNATLLSNTSLLITIAAIALNLLPGEGFVEPYIQALIFGAAIVLIVELHHQWPDDLQLQTFRKSPTAEGHSWRMTAFAFLLQLATVGFAVWAALSNPLILLPLTAVGIVLAFRRWYFRRYGGSRIGMGVGIVSLIAVLLISEFLMLAAWAIVADETITVEFWTEERESFDPAQDR